VRKISLRIPEIGLTAAPVASRSLQGRFEGGEQFLERYLAAHVHMERMFDPFHQLRGNIPFQDDRNLAHGFQTRRQQPVHQASRIRAGWANVGGCEILLTVARAVLSTSIPPQRPPGLSTSLVAGGLNSFTDVSRQKDDRRKDPRLDMRDEKIIWRNGSSSCAASSCSGARRISRSS